MCLIMHHAWTALGKGGRAPRILNLLPRTVTGQPYPQGSVAGAGVSRLWAPYTK
jgi:hypothetical protein